MKIKYWPLFLQSFKMQDFIKMCVYTILDLDTLNKSTEIPKRFFTLFGYDFLICFKMTNRGSF